MQTQVTNLRYRRVWIVRTGIQSVAKSIGLQTKPRRKAAMQTQVTNLRYRRVWTVADGHIICGERYWTAHVLWRDA